MRCHNTFRKATKERGTALFVLGIDTATPVTSVAVGSQKGTLASIAVRNDRAHAELLVPMVRQALEHAGLDGTELDGIAVGTGPGLFTGLRVGVSSAKAMAQVWDLPMVAVSSLEVLAFACRHAGRAICAAIDGDGALRHAETFARAGEAVELAGPERAVPSADALVQLALPRLEGGSTTRPLEVRPIYLRRPDVDPGVERRLAAERAAAGVGA